VSAPAPSRPLVTSGTRTLARRLWRGVEAQHLVATMKLVDSLAEQDVLEQILEDSKPPLPPGIEVMPYLISTPFRYRSPHPSRFRRALEPGIWYGAEDKQTACIEVAHWRWRFLMDSEGLREREVITEHTLFPADVRGRCIDLLRAPWSARAAEWTDPVDYRACQDLAAQARADGVAWIRYASAREDGGRCGAVLSPNALQLVTPPALETWVCKVGASQALMRHGDDKVTVRFAD
jgi:RES domain